MEETVEQQAAARKPKCSCGACNDCKRLARQRKWRRDNPERQKAKTHAWNQKNPAKLQEYRLKSVYALQPGEYDRMFAAQGGLCARCGKPETVMNRKTGKVRALSVDHCHNTQQIRSLLCHACNPRLGGREAHLKELAGDIAYLIEHESPAIEVLVQVLSEELGVELLSLVRSLQTASP